MFKKYLISLSIICTFISSLAHSRIAPYSVDWVVQKTAHFDVIYPAQQPDLGRYYADIAEDAYSHLSTVFTLWPDKITLVINDHTDNANGNATVFPYPLVVLYPVSSGYEDTLSESGEWAKELLTHELTHIAQLYPYKNGYTWLRPIFGSIISPNLLTPLWWKEGMAVEMETQFSKNGGRIRSFMQDAQMRAYYLSNKFDKYDLAQAGEVLVDWPYGNRPYFFGSVLMSQINTDKSMRTIGKIVDNYSGSIPYFLNTSLEKQLHSNFESEYLKALEHHRKIAENQITDLSKVSFSEAQPIDPDWLLSKTPLVTEKYLFFTAMGYKSTGLKAYRIDHKDNITHPLEKAEIKNLPSSADRYTINKNEDLIYYTKIDDYSSTEDYSDLYIYSLSTEKSEQLTHGARIRNPVLSFDENSILVTGLANGINVLKIFDIKSKTLKNIFSFDLKTKIDSYVYVTDSKILISYKTDSPHHNLYLLDIESLKIKTIPLNTENPRFLKYKNNTLFFNSTENGVSNIYQAEFENEKLKNIKPISHVKTGTLSFDVDTKNNILYSTVITENGPQVQSLKIKPDLKTLPKIINPILDRYTDSTQNSTLINSGTKDKTTTTEQYSGLSYLLPRYWIPFISSNTYNTGSLIQIMTSGQDPLAYHSYTINAGYDTGLNKLSYLASYTNSVVPWPVTLTGLQWQTLYSSGTIIDKNTLSLSAAPDLFSIHSQLKMSFGLLQNQTDDGIVQTEHQGGFIQFAYDDTVQKSNHYYPVGGISLSTRYSYLQQKKSLSQSLLDSYSQAQLNYVGYSSYFLPKNHVTFLKIDGIYTFQDVSSRFGTSSTVAPTGNMDILPSYTLRGYQAGQFFGNRLVTVNMEYRFPIKDITYGNGTSPFYFKYLTGHVVADGLATKGYGINKDNKTDVLNLEDSVYSAGVELRLSSTIGYVLPLNIVFGTYYPMNKRYADSISTGIAFQLGGL